MHETYAKYAAAKVPAGHHAVSTASPTIQEEDLKQTSLHHSSLRAGAHGHIVLVAGMHRSGTSAVTRVLNLCGADLPPGELWPPNDDNPDGYWESKLIVQIHDEALTSAGMAWDSTKAFPPAWFESELAATFRTRIFDLLSPKLADTRLLVIKDPRICHLVPLWRDVANALGLGISAVIPLRHPLEVAASLEHRNGMSRAQALLLWLRHVVQAERDTRGLPRCFITYESLMEDAPSTAHALARVLPVDAAALDRAIAAFMNPDRRHHHADPGTLAEVDGPSGWVTTAYDWTRRAARGEMPSFAVMDAVYDGLGAAESMFRPSLDDDAARVAALTARVAELLHAAARPLMVPQAELANASASQTAAPHNTETSPAAVQAAREAAAVRYAAVVVGNILQHWVDLRSVLDLGCGTGMWLRALSAHGQRDVFGVDIETHDPRDLEIDPELILTADLRRPVDLHRRFDLVICLDVAEQIDPRCAEVVVETCVRHADLVLFSTALPGQLGFSPVNEQPPQYWADHFARHGYIVLDLIRPLIWDNSQIPVWYRQNILLYARDGSTAIETLRARAKPDIARSPWRWRILTCCTGCPPSDSSR